MLAVIVTSRQAHCPNSTFHTLGVSFLVLETRETQMYTLYEYLNIIVSDFSRIMLPGISYSSHFYEQVVFSEPIFHDYVSIL